MKLIRWLSSWVLMTTVPALAVTQNVICRMNLLDKDQLQFSANIVLDSNSSDLVSGRATYRIQTRTGVPPLPEAPLILQGHINPPNPTGELSDSELGDRYSLNGQTNFGKIRMYIQISQPTNGVYNRVVKSTLSDETKSWSSVCSIGI